MNPPHRNVSVLLSVLLVVAALAAIIVGFVMRKKFFKLSTEALARQRLVEFPDVVVDHNVQLTRYVSMLKKHGSDKIHVAFRP